MGGLALVESEKMVKRKMTQKLWLMSPGKGDRPLKRLWLMRTCVQGRLFQREPGSLQHGPQ